MGKINVLLFAPEGLSGGYKSLVKPRSQLLWRNSAGEQSLEKSTGILKSQ